ncbi:hypothetical protein FHW89_004712 [Mucilaginibacter sp. SG564]|nr:hypothetical protein [Mucilaginibacter sp. SG564]
MNILLTFKTFLQLFFKRNVYEKVIFFIAILQIKYLICKTLYISSH